MSKPFKTIDGYIESFSEKIQPMLETLRQTIRKAAPPSAMETIAYNMPALEWNGTYLVYFACWKKHVSLYPISPAMERSMALTAYKLSGRGTIQFPIDRPLPLALIGKLVEQRVKEVREKAKR